MGRSWFYLTLWRGTPKEFTTEFNTQIQESNATLASIKRTDAAQTNINTIASLSANIRSLEAIGTDIITTTEVVWYVN